MGACRVRWLGCWALAMVGACGDTTGPAAGADAAVAAAHVDDCRPPLLFGHRGTLFHAPENTLQAFESAVEDGADGIEVDVRMTSDGQLVVLHDSTLQRTTELTEAVPVASRTLAEVQALDAGSWFDPAFAAARIPSVVELLDRFEDEPVLYLWDLKELDAAEALFELLEARGLQSRSILSSWTLSILERGAQLLPSVRTLYYPRELAELPQLDTALLDYVRVPKAHEAEVARVEEVKAHGFGVVISGSLISWRTSDRSLTDIGLVNDMRRTFQRRSDRRPAACPATVAGAARLGG